MKNDIIRKLTSLTLMSIMVAGGLTFAIPGALPQAVAETATSGALSVSNTEFGGQMILEIVLDDSDIKDVGIKHAQPTVEIGGDGVTMTQASTGKWYAYVTDDANTASGAAHPFVTDAIPSDNTKNVADGNLEGVDANIDSTASNGNLADGGWPFVQGFDFTDDTTLTVEYGSDSIDVYFAADLTGSASIAFDRADVPVGAMVHITITDPRLNLDPTAEDVWTLNIPSTPLTTDYDGTSVDLGSDGHGTLTVSDDLTTDAAETVTTITFTETGGNTNEFASYNDDDESSIILSNTLESTEVDATYAGESATLIVTDAEVGISIATDDVWNSGETASVTLSDPDLDTNTRTAQEITLENDDIPIIRIGEPTTIDMFTYDADATATDTENLVLDMDDKSGTITFTNMTAPNDENTPGTITNPVFNLTGFDTAASSYYVAFKTSADDPTEFTLFNDDDVDPNNATAGVVPNVDGVIESMPTNLQLTLTGNFANGDAVAFDILSFGAPDVNNAIYRHLLVETDGGTFEGTIKHIMLSQVNINDGSTYAGIETNSDELVIIMNSEAADDDEPEIDYAGETARAAVTTNTGTVTLDADRYSTHGTVVVTVADDDLNVDNTEVERYVLDQDGNIRGTTDTVILTFEINDRPWKDCDDDQTPPQPRGLGLPSAFTLVEDAAGSGTFVADFPIPTSYCDGSTDGVGAVTGKSLKATYEDFRDSTGITSSWSDSATIQAVTGTISLDRSVYPVPSAAKNVTVYIEINDPDFNDDSDVINKIPSSAITIEISTGTADLDPIGHDTVGLGANLEETSKRILASLVRI